MKLKPLLIVAACWLTAFASTSRADVYPCSALNTFANARGTGYQLTSVQVTNDSANLYFNINLAAGSASWVRYAIAFVTGPGGCTSGNGSIHSGTTTSLAEGMTYWIACAGNAGNNVATPLYAYNTTTLTWSTGSGPTVIAQSTPTVSITVPYASLGLSPGATVTFDVFTYDGSSGGTTCDLATDPITTTWYNQTYTGQNIVTFPKPVVVIPAVVKAGTGTELTTGASWTGGNVPSASQTAAWGTGSLGAGLTLANAITWTSLRVTNALSDIDISGAGSLTLSNGMDLSVSPVNLTIANPVVLASSQTWAVNSGKTLTVSGGVSDGGSTLSLTALGGGMLALTGVNTYSGYTTLTNVILSLVSPGALYTTAWNNVAVVSIQNGAVVQFDNWGYGTTVSFGQLDTGVGRIVLNGGTLQCVAASGTGYPRSLTIGAAGGTLNSSVAGQLWDISATGNPTTLPINGLLSLTGAGDGEIDVSVTGPGGLTLSGSGTWTLAGVNTFSGATTVGAGTLAVGGTGQLGSGNYSATIADNGTLNYNSSSAQTLSGVISGNGTLNVNGGGTLTLSANNTYSGATEVTSGELIGVTGGSLSNSAVTVASGASGAVQILAAGSSWACANLTFADGANDNFIFSTNSPNAIAPQWVNGNLVLQGALNIGISAIGGITRGVYPLIHYTGTLSGTPTAAPAFLPTGWTGIISNDVANKSLDLVVTTSYSVATLSWAVGNNNWDIDTTANWKNNGGPLVTYADPDTVVLNDSASGTSPIDVTLNATVNPFTVTANVTNKNYILDGSGAIAGPASLTKNGPGALTLSGPNSYNGGTILTAGQLNLNFGGDGGPDSAIGIGALHIAGSCAIDNTSGSDVDLLPVIPEFWNASFTYIGSANNLNLGSGPVTLGTNCQVTVLANNLTVGGVIGDGGNGYALAIGGTGGSLTLTNQNTYTGNTTVSNAELILTAPGAIYAAAWNPYATVTIESNAVLQFDSWGYGSTVSFGDLDFGSARLVVNGGTLRNVSAGGTVSQRGCSVGPAGGTLDSGPSNWHIQYQDSYPTMTITGLLTLAGGVSTGTIDKGLIGVGGVTVNSSGFWILTASNTYTGNTVINAGTLQLTGSASIANSPLISVTNGAIFDVSELSATFNVVANQTLGGSGTINGNVTSDGTISPGPSAGSLSTLTFNNDLTFDGNLVFEVNTSLAQSNDIVSASTISNAGTGMLTVENLGPNLTVGEQFFLFNQPVANGGALTISAPPGVTFANHLALNGSITVASVVAINPNPTNLNFSANGNALHLAWPTDHLGWLVQSNSVNMSVPADWHDVPNSQSATSLTVPINAAGSQVFYRLRRP